ncbi:hypothetical protein BH23ACT10_BH23ACT10_17000 [soil metagenome]
MRGWVMVAVIGLGTLLLVVLGIRALLRGRSVPTKAKLAVAGAIVWLLSPIDVIPDFIPALGVLDDVAVLIATVRYVLEHLEPNRPVEQRPDRHRTIDVSDWRISDDPPDT